MTKNAKALSSEDVKKIQSIIDICLMTGIDSVLLEGGVAVRGISDDRASLIISTDDVPELVESAVMGLSRLNILKSRLAVLKDASDFSISVETNAKNEVVMLHLNSAKAKTKFRCASPSIIKAPKSVNDSEFAIILIQKSDIQTISQAAKAMGAKQFTLACTQAGEGFEARIEYYDETQDVFSIKVMDDVEFMDDAEGSFIHYYNTDAFLSLLRNVNTPDNEPIPLVIGKSGTLKIICGPHPITLIPRIRTEDNDD